MRFDDCHEVVDMEDADVVKWRFAAEPVDLI